MLPQYQINANEQFFSQMMNLLTENAKWVWPMESEMFTYKNGKFYGNKKAYKKISQIVSKKFLENNFCIQ